MPLPIVNRRMASLVGTLAATRLSEPQMGFARVMIMTCDKGYDVVEMASLNMKSACLRQPASIAHCVGHQCAEIAHRSRAPSVILICWCLIEGTLIFHDLSTAAVLSEAIALVAHPFGKQRIERDGALFDLTHHAVLRRLFRHDIGRIAVR